MNTIAIVACLVLGCIAISEAQQRTYEGRTRPFRPITGVRYCRDYLSNAVSHLDSYCDGSNTCVCVNGMPSQCYQSNCARFRGGNIHW